MTNKVYIPNKGSGHDFSPAEYYGEIVYVTEGIVNPFDTGIIYRRWIEATQDSSENDLIVVSSLPLISIIGAAILAKKHNVINLLLYTRREEYEKRKVVLR